MPLGLPDPQMIDAGWRQIVAGGALIIHSKLAFWNAQSLRLLASEEHEFETSHKALDRQFGRLICWIQFSVGAEYLAKGACILHGCNVIVPANAIRLPLPGDDIDNWVRLVNKNDPSITEPGAGFGTLSNLPLGKILKPGQERDLVLASFKALASAIRKRGAHRYAHHVRSSHFHLVESLFVPAFNILLASLDRDELRVRSELFGAHYAISVSTRNLETAL